MARIMDITKHQVLHTAFRLIAAAIPLGLSACVSTEELYAQYDEQTCVFVVEKTPGTEQTLTVREEVSNLVYAWEPAVYFAYDDATLSDESKKILNTSLPILKQFQQLHLSLQGFTDSRGSQSYNMKLATRRVESVLTYLQAQGVSADRISLQPLGKGLPNQGDNIDRAHANNRRVELMLLDEQGKPLHLRYNFAVD